MNDPTQPTQTAIVPLPKTTGELLARRTIKLQRTLNDHIDDIHVILWTNPRYQELLDAVYDEDATEGSLAIDNFLAASMIRDYARGEIIWPARPNTPSRVPADKAIPVDHLVKDKKLGTLVKALGVVLRRYHLSRKERAITVGGEQFPYQSDNSNNT